MLTKPKYADQTLDHTLSRFKFGGKNFELNLSQVKLDSANVDLSSRTGFLEVIKGLDEKIL